MDWYWWLLLIFAAVSAAGVIWILWVLRNVR